MSFFQIIILMFVGCIIAYLFTDRICKCIEHKHTSKSFDLFMKEIKDNADEDDEVTIQPLNKTFDKLDKR